MNISLAPCIRIVLCITHEACETSEMHLREAGNAGQVLAEILLPRMQAEGVSTTTATTPKASPMTTKFAVVFILVALGLFVAGCIDAAFRGIRDRADP